MKVSLSVNHLYLLNSVRHVADKLAAVRYSCSYSVSHTSLFTPHWSAPFKISSPFFYPSSFRWEADAASQLYSQISHLIDHGQRKKKIRPGSSLIGDSSWVAGTSLPWELWLRDGTSECRMKPAHLRLESLSGIFHCFCSAQGTKPKCCHLHIFLVEGEEKSREHFGERFKLGMCLFPGLACLALNEIQSVFRQHQIRHN